MTLPNKFEENQDLTLNDFPSSLRKLAKFMLNNEDIMIVSEAIKKGNFNYSSITTIMSREKKKGKDFKKFMNNQMQLLLNGQKLKVAKALIAGAVSNSHADRKLYFLLTRDLETDNNPGIHIKHLTIGINQLGTRPADLSKEKGIIDINPEIPKIKE